MVKKVQKASAPKTSTKAAGKPAAKPANKSTASTAADKAQAAAELLSTKLAALSGFNPASLLDPKLASNVRDSAQHIWAAGLGAFSKAQGEGAKVFEALVGEGLKLQKKTQSLAEQKMGAVASRVTGVAGGVSAKAGQQWDKLESIFEERVARALKSLGVPSSADIDTLVQRIDALSQAVGRSAAAPAAATSPARKATPPSAQPKVKAAAKPVAKPAAKPAVKAAAKAAGKPTAKPVKAVKAVPATPTPKVPKARKAAPARSRKAAAPAAADGSNATA